jgi:hypothetical protein
VKVGSTMNRRTGGDAMTAEMQGGRIASSGSRFGTIRSDDGSTVPFAMRDCGFVCRVDDLVRYRVRPSKRGPGEEAFAVVAVARTVPQISECARQFQNLVHAISGR